MEQQPALCVLRLSALGDCINAFGLLGALKQSYPAMPITWVIDKRFAPLFCDEQGHDLISMVRVDFKGQGLKSVLDLKKQLKGQSFTQLFNLQTSIKSSLCSLAIKAQAKYGYDKERAREGHSLFINHAVPSPTNPHVLSGFLAFAKAANLPVKAPYWDFKLDPYLIDKAQCLLNHERTFVISPCSAKANKNWTIKGYIALAQHAQSKGLQVALLGGPSTLEKDTCAHIEQECPSCINLCGKTTLRELAAILSISKLLLAPDSGSMHLASALNTPVIGLFARHDDKRVGPWNFMDLNVSVYHELAKQELQSDTIPWRYRIKQEQAMEHITIERVIQAFDEACLRFDIL